MSGSINRLAAACRNQPLTISGWAIDRRATTGTGIDQVVVYANRLPDSGGGVGTMAFVGTAEWGLARPDIGNAFGAQFVNSGYRLSVNGLPPGSYRLAVYAHTVGATVGRFHISKPYRNHQRTVMCRGPRRHSLLPAVTQSRPGSVQRGRRATPTRDYRA